MPAPGWRGPHLRRVLISGQNGPWEDHRCVRDALARLWAPDTELVIRQPPSPVEVLAGRCWTAWSGTVRREPCDHATHGDAAEVMRAAAMVFTGARGLMRFQSRHSPPDMLTLFAELTGIPV